MKTGTGGKKQADECRDSQIDNPRAKPGTAQDLDLRAQLIVLEQTLGLVIKQLPDRDRDFLCRAITFRQALFEDAAYDAAFAPDLAHEERVRLAELVQVSWKAFNGNVLGLPELDEGNDRRVELDAD